MNYEEYIEMGLNGEVPLKIILRGSVEKAENNKVGVVSVVYATTDKEAARDKMGELIKKAEASGCYYMVYSVPLDTDLTALDHYPSIAITQEDLK